MTAKQPLPNQHDLLHPFYGQDNCCLCKAEQRIRELEAFIAAEKAKLKKPQAQRPIKVGDKIQCGVCGTTGIVERFDDDGDIRFNGSHWCSVKQARLLRTKEEIERGKSHLNDSLKYVTSGTYFGVDIGATTNIDASIAVEVDGNGVVTIKPVEQGEPCHWCNGRGRIKVPAVYRHKWLWTWASPPCPICEGTGRKCTWHSTLTPYEKWEGYPPGFKTVTCQSCGQRFVIV